MALIENEIDRQLAANVDQVEAGVDPSRALLLNCSAPGGFKKNEAGTLAPAEIVFDAFPLNMPGAVVQWVTDGVDIVVEGNRATLAAAAMGERELALVKLTLAYEGVTHEREHTVQVVDVSAGGLVGSLTGQITENELHESLRSRVDLVDAFADVPGSVAARVKAETDARMEAIDAEVQNRMDFVENYAYNKSTVDAAISSAGTVLTTNYKGYADGVATAAAADVRSYSYSKSGTDSAIATTATQLRSEFSSVAGVSAAWVQEYAYSKADANSAEAAQSAQLTTNYKAYADGVATAASADVRSYSYSKSGTDGAIASLASTLRSEFASTAGVSAAYVQNYTYSKSEANSAIAASESTLRSEFASTAGVSAAWVQNYAYSKSTVDSSFAAQFNSLTTNYKGYADGVATAAAADVRTYSYSKSTVDGAFSSWAQQLRSEFQAIEGGVSAAYVQNYTYSQAEANSAIASQTSDLRSTVGGHNTTIQTQATTINGLSGQYTVKIDNNGYVTGYGLASSYNNGVPTSAFVVNADRFAIVSPGHAPKTMFSVGNANGVTTIGFSGMLIGPSGTLNSLHIVDGGGIHGGAFTEHSWPSSGIGFFIGPPGALFGNPNTGRYFQVESNGNIHSSHFNVIDGVGSLGALNIGAGGHIKKGMTGYGQGVGFFLGEHDGLNKFIVGNPNGAMMWWDGYQLQQRGVAVQNPVVKYDFSVWIDNIRSTGNPQNSNATAGSGAHISNGSGNYAYSWALGGSPSLRLKSSPGASYASVECSGNGWHYGSLTLTIRDLNTGAVANAETEVAFQIGSYAEP